MEIDNKKKWILLGIVIKLIWLVLIIFYDNNLTISKPYFLKGDALEYVGLVNNLIENGSYYHEASGFTGRMPGLAFILYPLMLVFGKQLGLTIFVYLQSILLGITTYYLALTSFNLFKSKKAFLATFIIFSLSSHSSNWTSELYTEGLAIPLVILFVYALSKKDFYKNKLQLFTLGLILTWLVFLRAYMIPLLAIPLIPILFLNRIQKIKLSLYYLTPIIICISIWTTRNFNLTNKLIPLQTSMDFRKDTNSFSRIYDFIESFGGSAVFWSEKTHGTWFRSEVQLNKINIQRPPIKIFPTRIFNDSLTRDSLILARKFHLLSRNDSVTKKTSKKYDEKSRVILEKFIAAYKKDHPVYYYFIDRLNALYKFLDQPIGKSFKSLSYPFNVIVTFVQSSLYYFYMIFGLLGLFTSISLTKSKFICEKNLITSIPLFVLLIFPVILKTYEARFIELSIPFIILFSSYMVKKIIFDNPLKWKLLILSSFIIILSLRSIIININW